jgi:hypothetical protein
MLFQNHEHFATKNWTPADLNRLLDSVQLFKPLGASTWDNLADYFNAEADILQSANQLKRKYTKLANMKKPTGKSKMAPYIKRARELYTEI